jgi:hypothetical protein
MAWKTVERPKQKILIFDISVSNGSKLTPQNCFMCFQNFPFDFQLNVAEWHVRVQSSQITFIILSGLVLSYGLFLFIEKFLQFPINNSNTLFEDFVE